QREKDPEKKYPHRAVLYIHTHQTNSERNTNAHVDHLKQLIGEQPDLADTSQGKVAWKGDALNKILGEEKPGHVHGLGLVPNPNQVFEPATSRRLKKVNLTSLDEKSSEDVVSLRLQQEKLGHRVQNQDATILELQEKIKILEKRQRVEGCLDDPEYVPKDGFCMDASNSKRKRVYGDPQHQQFSTVEQQIYTMREQPSAVDDEDLQPQNKYYCAQDKGKATNAPDKSFLQVNSGPIAQKAKGKFNHENIGFDTSKYTNAPKRMVHETSPSSSNLKDSHFENKKRSSGPSATKLASKIRRGTTNFSAANSMKAGTNVFLKSWKNQNKDVALATVVSCDPTQKLEGVPLGKEFWMVLIDIPIVHDEPLIRPYKNYSVIGEVPTGVNIAWPSTFVQKINP
ncbi:unnamed protein product, partial [Urochloa humidicola]